MQKCLNSMINRHKRICQMICEEKCSVQSYQALFNVKSMKRRRRKGFEKRESALSAELEIVFTVKQREGRLLSFQKLEKRKMKKLKVKSESEIVFTIKQREGGCSALKS